MKNHGARPRPPQTTTKRSQRRERGQLRHRWVYPAGFHLALDVAPLGVVTRTASKDHGCVPMAVAAGLPGGRHQPLDLGRR